MWPFNNYWFDRAMANNDRLLDILNDTLLQVVEKITEISKTMATQDDINKLAAQEAADVQAIADDLTQINSALTATSTAIGDAIAAAKAGGSVDISELENNQAKLDAAATALGGVANAISALVPTNGLSALPAQAPASDPATPTETDTL